eukprot:TRINITY_DN63405_c0_g1_i1.p1 TRINITY_DN63405_c0_g1~~TRINITY_DN63405_c0_g1_i1.p1  ORF type:complete len:549 (+),score=95.60 TRINITY_DN63405_c0_g1_i1:209-1648(+)
MLQATKFSAHTLGLSLIAFTLGCALTVPLSLLASTAFEHIDATLGEGYGIDRLMLSGEDDSESAEDSVQGHWVVTRFKILQYCASASANLGCRWAVMALAWQGWKKSRGLPLLVLIAASLTYVGVYTTGVILQTFGIMKVRAELFAICIITPSNFMAMVMIVKLSSTQSWSHVMKLVCWSTILDWCCAICLVFTIIFFFSLQSSTLRVIVRVVLPMLVRRVWLHCSFHLSLRFEVTDTNARFMMMLIPIASTAAVGTCLQMGSNIEEAALMSLCNLGLEVSDAMILLSGSTQLETTYKSMRWAVRQARTQFSDITGPQDDAEEVKKEAAKDPLQEELERELRKALLASAAVHACVAEGASLAFFSMQQLILPISLEEGGVPVPREETIEVFIVSLLTEFFGDAVVAAVSFGASRRWPQYFTAASEGRRVMKFCSLHGALTVIIIAVVSTDYVGLYLSSLCVSHKTNAGKTLGFCKSLGM